MAGNKKSQVAAQTNRIELAELRSADLVARWSAGDQGAAQEIFARYLDRLTALARVRLSASLAGRLDADDVVMSAYRSFFVGARDGRFACERAGDLWRLLVEITLHKLYRAAAHHRAQRRNVAAETAQGAMQGIVNNLISREPQPEAVAAVADELQAVLAQLPAVGRRVLELRLQGLEIRQIAHELRRSQKTVRRWLDTARQQFRARGSLLSKRPAMRSRMPSGRASARERPTLKSVPAPLTPLARHPLQYGDYLLRRMIGAGASGKVYIALCRSTATEVAVKFLRKSFVRDAEAVTRFLAEADMLKDIKHRGIIRIHGVGADRRSGYFIVMDLARGGDLGRCVEAGPVSIAEAVRWTIEAAEAIGQAHRRGVIHCDLKPSNLLLDSDRHVVVTDFGLARSYSAAVGAHTALAGTPSFMAPEQITNVWGTPGPQTDVYGLGAVLYTLLTGQPPVSGRRICDILANIVAVRAVPPPESLRARIPAKVSQICMRCLAKRPVDRFASAAAVVQALRSHENS